MIDDDPVLSFCTSRIRSAVSTSSIASGLSKVIVISGLILSRRSSFRAAPGLAYRILQVRLY